MLRRSLESSGKRRERWPAQYQANSSLHCSGNEVTGVIHALSELCGRDPSVEVAFLCSPAIIHISKKPGQGQLCGYRNIQMLISYICGAYVSGGEKFTSGVPSVPQLQLLIEAAWNKGINADGRIDTGGIKGTRKHIGTPEVCSLFTACILRAVFRL